MPHKIEEGEHAVRTTEAISTIQCEERAYHTKQLIKKLNAGVKTSANNVLTFATLKGTIVHHKIENFLRKEIDLPPIPLSKALNENEEKFLFQIEQNEVLSEELTKLVQAGFLHFLDFWNEFDPIPVAIEESVIGNIKVRHDKTGRMVDVKVKGTMDSVLLIKESKLDEHLGVEPRSDEYRMIICDWKSGSSSRNSHKFQISIYYDLAEQSFLPRLLKKYKYYEVAGVKKGMDVYTGGGGYKAKVFDINRQHFSYIVGLFVNAERVPRNRNIQGRIGIQLTYCLFCPFRDQCSAFLEEEVELLSAEEYNNQREGKTYPYQFTG